MKIEKHYIQPQELYKLQDEVEYWKNKCEYSERQLDNIRRLFNDFNKAMECESEDEE